MFPYLLRHRSVFSKKRVVGFTHSDTRMRVTVDFGEKDFYNSIVSDRSFVGRREREENGLVVIFQPTV